MSYGHKSDFQDGGRRHVEFKKNSIFGHVTTAYIEPDYSHVTKNWNFEKFKMAVAAILKIVFLAITHQPIVRL